MRRIISIILVLAFTWTLPSLAQSSNQNKALDAALLGLKIQTEEIQQGSAASTLCMELVVSVNRQICTEKGSHSGLKTAQIFIDSMLKEEQGLVCDVFDDKKDHIQCLKEPTLKAAFLSVSKKICGGCVTWKGTLTDLQRAKDTAQISQVNITLALVQETQRELEQVKNELEAASQQLAQIQAAAAALVAQINKAATCKATSDALKASLSPKKVAKK